LIAIAAVSVVTYLAVAGTAHAATAEPLAITRRDLDTLWVLISAALVFFMQTGFLCFEVGMVRPKNAWVTAAKNVADWTVISIAYFFIGFGLQYGHSAGGVIGTSLFAGVGIDDPAGNHLSWTYFLFQLAFSGTAATIVSGAMAERVNFKAYLFVMLTLGLVVYPVWGHWVWGNGFYSSNKPWLQSMGFMDFAGGSAVHMVGGFAALAGIAVLGPRLGRYSRDGQLKKMDSYGMSWSAVGTLILWFGWWGFNGGSTLAFNQDVGIIIFNTNISAAVGGLVAFVHCSALQGRRDIDGKFLGGILGGLVAITPCANVVTPVGAVLVGASAGLVHNISFDLVIRRWRLDDVVGAVPVHAFCGMWGLFCVALFGVESKLALPRTGQMLVQLLGIVACATWTLTVTFITLKFVKAVFGVRVTAMHEINGLSLEDEDDEDQADLTAMSAAAAPPPPDPRGAFPPGNVPPPPMRR
jgi:Amt family ammonium transporter